MAKSYDWEITNPGKPQGLDSGTTRLAVSAEALAAFPPTQPNALTEWRSADGRERLTTVDATSVWVEQSLAGAWDGSILASRIMADPSGQPVIGEIRVFPNQDDRWPLGPGEWSAAILGAGARSAVPAGGISATLVRKGLPISAHVRYASGLLGQTAAGKNAPVPAIARTVEMLEATGFVLRPFKWPRAKSDVVRRGRPTLRNAADYARIALIYDDAVRAGVSPIQAIAKRERVTPANARNLVAKARKPFGTLPDNARQGARPLHWARLGARTSKSRSPAHGRKRPRGSAEPTRPER